MFQPCSPIWVTQPIWTSSTSAGSRSSSSDDAPPVDLARLVERVETSLLGGERKYNRLEMAEKSGIGLEDVRALWRALGFATVDDVANATLFLASNEASFLTGNVLEVDGGRCV